MLDCARLGELHCVQICTEERAGFSGTPRVWALSSIERRKTIHFVRHAGGPSFCFGPESSMHLFPSCCALVCPRSPEGLASRAPPPVVPPCWCPYFIATRTIPVLESRPISRIPFSVGLRLFGHRRPYFTWFLHAGIPPFYGILSALEFPIQSLFFL